MLEYLSNRMIEQNAPGANNNPISGASPSSNSDSDSRPPRTRRARKWTTRRTNGRLARVTCALACEGGDDVVGDSCGIHLLRQFHEAAFETPAGESGFDFVKRARNYGVAFLEKKKMRAEPFHLLEHRRREDDRLALR